MEHYIIVKFSQGYKYLNELEKITDLFNESLKLEGVNSVDVYKSNSNLNNRYDLMIKMKLTKEGLNKFDNSWIHEKWKNDYGKYINSKTIFDCD